MAINQLQAQDHTPHTMQKMKCCRCGAIELLPKGSISKATKRLCVKCWMDSTFPLAQDEVDPNHDHDHDHDHDHEVEFNSDDNDPDLYRADADTDIVMVDGAFYALS